MATYRHYTDDELRRHCENNPGDLEAEGELVRRVLADEWDNARLQQALEDRDQYKEDMVAARDELKRLRVTLKDVADEIMVDDEEAEETEAAA